MSCIMVARKTKRDIHTELLSVTIFVLIICRPLFSRPTYSMECDSAILFTGSTESIISCDPINCNSSNKDTSSTCTKDKTSFSIFVISLLSTFVGYPVQSAISTVRLAFAGLKYTKYEDEVRCDCCKFQYKGWVQNGDPLQMHSIFSSNCKVVQRAIKENNRVINQVEPDVNEEYNQIAIDYAGNKPNTEEDIKYGDVDLSMNSLLGKSGTSRIRGSKRENLEAITEENTRLTNESICVKCRENKVDCLALPCRHLAACEKCLDAADHCFACSMHILGTAKTYLV